MTHALHFLPQVDYIFTVVDGRIAERGTYADLMQNDGTFSKFVHEFGSQEEEKKEVEEEEDAIDAGKGGEKKERKPDVIGASQMQAEERNTGAISGQIYKDYAKAGNGAVVLPFLAFALVFLQGSNVMSSYW